MRKRRESAWKAFERQAEPLPLQCKLGLAGRTKEWLFPSGASTAAIINDSTSEVFISPHLSPLLTTQKSSWGKLTGLLKTVHQVGTKIIY